MDGRKTYRIGIIGTGRIARRFVKEALYVDGARITAVYNPHEGSAEQFARSISENKAVYEVVADEAGNWLLTADMELLWADVDAVYIASPHGTHVEYVMQALEHGKHVLCEKPMALTRMDAERAFALAKEKDLVLMEELKTAYCPGFRKVIDLVESGVIGAVCHVEATFTKLENPQGREFTDSNVAGSFYELGSYGLLPVIKVLGADWDDVRFDSIRNEDGVDVYTEARFLYGRSTSATVVTDGNQNCQKMATVAAGLGVKKQGDLIISGTKGYIRVPAPWWKTTEIQVCFENTSENQIYHEQFEGDGIRYVLEEMMQRIAALNCNTCRQNGLMDEESTAMASVMEQFKTKDGI